MTINGGQPHRAGYTDQDFRVVVDEERPGQEPRVKRLGWMNVPPSLAILYAMNQHLCWSNARGERVEVKAAKAQISAEQAANKEQRRALVQVLAQASFKWPAAFATVLNVADVRPERLCHVIPPIDPLRVHVVNVTIAAYGRLTPGRAGSFSYSVVRGRLPSARQRPPSAVAWNPHPRT